METGSGDALGLLIQLGIVILVVGVLVWQGVKRVRAMREPLRDDRCVSCDSVRLSPLGPGRYRCQDCGYVGGSGMAAYQEQKQLEAVSALPTEDRLRGAIRDLEEARTLLRAILDSSSAFWESGGGVGMAEADLNRAKQAMNLASQKLADPYLATTTQAPTSGDVAAAHVVGAVEAQMGMGDFVAGTVAASGLGRMKAEAQALLQRVDAALSHWGPQAIPVDDRQGGGPA